jgi:hypothetical protein
LFQIRTFQWGDEIRLVGLANHAFAAFGGHVVRDVEGWRWSILGRPGVSEEDIVILANEEHVLLGYAVLGAEGVVLELALDPELAGRERAAAAQHLVGALEARCQSRGLETITFELPILDDVVRRILVGDGYREEATRSFTVNVIDLPGLLQKIIAHHRDSLPSDWRGDFLLDVDSGTYPSHRRTKLLVEIGPKSVVVSEAKANGPPASTGDPIEIATDLSAITEIVFGRSSFDAAREASRIRLHSAESEPMARTLFELMTIRSPWYTPPADGR